LPRPCCTTRSRTPTTTSSQLERDFGDGVAALVDGVTKLDKVTYGAAAQAETVRKMVVAMARDIRVLVIKLADRLHNMRTWRYLSRDKQERKARRPSRSTPRWRTAWA
jgi:guanosine-3',5'-bis(diphosphate) 3'-pyrophosphohydrolase